MGLTAQNRYYDFALSKTYLQLLGDVNSDINGKVNLAKLQLMAKERSHMKNLTGQSAENQKSDIRYYEGIQKLLSDFASSLSAQKNKLNKILDEISSAGLYYTPITINVFYAHEERFSSSVKESIERLIITSNGTFTPNPGLKAQIHAADLEANQAKLLVGSYKQSLDILRKTLAPPPEKKPDDKTKASSKTPPGKPKTSGTGGSGGGGSGGATTNPSSSTETVASSSGESEAFKMQLRGIVDSDQCKITRMYNFFEEYFFEKVYQAHPYYRNLSSNPPSGNYQIFEYIPKASKRPGINPSILSRDKLQDMPLWYLRNDITSLFYSKIEIFKVYREKVGNSFTGNFSKITKIHFPAYSGDTISGDGTGLNASILSFNWNYIGTDSFTAEKDIEATLEVSLESIDALFTTREYNGNLYRLSDLIIQPDCFRDSGAGNVSQPTSAQPSTNLPDDARLPWIPECYEVMVNVGNYMPQGAFEEFKNKGVGLDSWTDPRLTFSKFSSSSFSKFATTLFLTLVDHSFTFGDNGAIKLKVNYRARLSSVMRGRVLDVNSPRGSISDEQTTELLKILGLANENGSRAASSRTLLEGADQDAEIFSDDSFGARTRIAVADAAGDLARGTRAVFGDTTPDSGTTPENYTNISDLGLVYQRLEERKLKYTGVETSKKRLKRVDEGLSYIRKIATKKFFQRVLARLLKSERVEILTLTNAEETKKYIQNPTTENLIKSIDELQKLFENPVVEVPAATPPTTSTTTPASTTPPATPNATASTSTATNGRGSPVQTVSTTEQQRQVQQQQQAATGESNPGSENDDANQTESNGVTKSEPKNISFVFFFDIVTAVIHELIENDSSGQAAELMKSFRILYTNLLLPDKEQNFSSDKKTWKPFNIAATPIALSTFNNFVANVAEQGKEKYPLFAVLRDMVNQLLADSLGSECVDQYNSPTFIQKFLQLNDYSGDITKIDQSYSLDTDGLGEGVSVSPGRGGYVNAKKLAKDFSDFYNIEASYNSGRRLPRPTELLAISFENTIYADVATGDFNIDNRNGIPHIRYLDSRGLIVTIGLEKTDQPFLREARYADNSGYSLMQLSNVYDLTITMKGNNLLLLGGLVYLDPSSLGLSLGSPKDRNSFSHIMGIGGLYVVTKIEHTVTASVYRTIAKARFVSRGDL